MLNRVSRLLGVGVTEEGEVAGHDTNPMAAKSSSADRAAGRQRPLLVLLTELAEVFKVTFKVFHGRLLVLNLGDRVLEERFSRLLDM